MRRLTSLFLLVLLASPGAWSRSFTASDKPLRPGWWYDPATPGLAFTLSPAGNALAGALLTFDAAGEPVWYLVVGEGDGTRWSLPLTRHYREAQGPGRSETVGNFTFTVEGEERVHASWSIDGTSGSASLVPLALAPGYSAEDRSGHWFAPAEPGRGFTFLSQGAFLAGVHYGFDAQGNPRWFYGDNGGVRDRSTLDAVYFRKPCATCAVSVHAAGTMDVRFEDEFRGQASVSLDIPAPTASRFSRDNLGLVLISDLPSGRAHPTALAHFANSATLTDYLREAAPNSSLGMGICFAGVDFSAAPPEATSSTNVQEEGVDEADLMDADGEYVYSVFPSTGDRPQRLRTHRLRPEVADLELLSDLDFVSVDEEAPAVSGLYLVEPSGGPRRLAVVRGQDSGYAFFAPRCGPRGNSRTEIEIYELGERGRPTLLHRLAFEGGLVASRRIGRELIVVTRYRPEVPGLVYDATDASDRARNAALLDAQSLATLAPRSTLDLGTPQPLVTPATTWLPPLPPGEREASLLTVTTVPLDDPADRTSLTLVGTDDGAYVASSALYLATSRYPATFDGSRFAYPEEFATDFHRIALAPLAYRASGTAPGSLGGSIDQKPFRMSEHAGHFRAITELSGRPANGRYRLAVFAENPATLKLDEVAHLPNEDRPQPIGKPDELLYAVRFAGDRAYAVTFLSIDPLYTIDLSDPRSPRLSGELEMPGYSAYLHPLGAGGLLGIGKDAVPADRGGDDFSFAWYQGLLLASFDVSDASAPRRVASRNIGRRGSESALLHDHHALAFAPAGGGTTRLAFPVAIHDAASASQVSSDPTTYYPFRYSGLATFEVAPGGALIDRGTLIAARAEDTGAPPELLYGTHEARALLVGDAVYLYQGGWWLGARWGSADQPSPPR